MQVLQRDGYNNSCFKFLSYVPLSFYAYFGTDDYPGKAKKVVIFLVPNYAPMIVCSKNYSTHHISITIRDLLLQINRNLHQVRMSCHVQ